ncbi:MAG TPA: AAA family ATPase [Pyrinomonadaceae bacterium]|nr:AAA family ATPase [Pyrinomonadaceae bacterium]
MVEANEAGLTDSAAEPHRDWRAALNAWLAHNPKVIPAELRELREEFVRRFPKEKLSEMTLNEYALGTEEYKDSFCYWLEYKTQGLGSIKGGNTRKFGLWWDWKGGMWRWIKVYASPEDALNRIKQGLSALVSAAEAGRFEALDSIGREHLGQFSYSLRCKPLSLYFPEEFLSIFSFHHLKHFLKIFGVEPEGEVLKHNRQLLARLRSLPEFAGFDTTQLMLFLYDSFPPPANVATPDDPEGTPPLRPPSVQVPHELAQLMDMTGRTRNILLYGPPGTGKTWLVNHFTNYFLLHHNVSPEAARAYWQAKGSPDASRLQAQVRAGETEAATGEAPAFWFMVANETKTEWSWQLLFDRGEWFFGKGHLSRNFEAAKPGDLIFGYMASPRRQVVALARVEGRLETREEDGKPKEGILIKPLAMLAHPLDWHKFISHPSLRNSEPLKMNARGSMFRLTVEEARALADLLNAEGNDISLPSNARGDFAEFVTFHQSFAYEEFVEGLKPVLSAGGEAGGIEYEIKPGVFRDICARAEAAWRLHGEAAPKYLLVIDEINRANIAKVLGELITLIEDDKRLGEANELTVRLPASGERFGVPPNLYVLGTMNTADRSIALLDLALRRRFTFVEMRPQPSVIDPPVVAGVNLRTLLARLNERIAALRDRDHQIGHSYLMRLTGLQDLHFAWYRRVVPLLQEYFYNDGERLKAVIGGRFVRPVKMSATGAAFKELYDAEQPPHEVVELQGEEFLEALRVLAGGAAAADVETEATA